MALKNKVILVTGGTSGIGEGCARHFASLGARIVIASNQADRGAALEAGVLARHRLPAGSVRTAANRRSGRGSGTARR